MKKQQHDSFNYHIDDATINVDEKGHRAAKKRQQTNSIILFCTVFLIFSCCK